MEGSDAVLVTGGSGYIGSCLLSHLSKENLTTLCLYRHKVPSEIAGIYPVCNDLTSSDLLAAPLRGVSTVVHLAWENNFISKGDLEKKNVFKSKNLVCLANLLTACEKAGVEKFIFMSAYGANKNDKNYFLSEKYLGEVLVLNSKIHERRIVRSTVVFSKERNLFIDSVSRLFNFPMIVPIPFASELVSPIHLSDISKYLVSIIKTKKPNDANSTIDYLGGKRPIHMKSMIGIYGESIGRSKSFFVTNKFSNAILPAIDRKEEGGQIKPGVIEYLSTALIKESKPNSHLIDQLEFKAGLSQ